MKNAQTTLWVVLVIVIILIIGGFVIFMNINPATTGSSMSQQTTSNPSTSQSQNSETSNLPSQTYNVEIKNFAFSPSALTIKKSDKVIWTNQDSAMHTIVSDSGNEIISPSLITGNTYVHVFNTAGTYNYHCGIHPNMKGEIIVQ